MDPRVAAVPVEKFWERVLIAGEGCWLWDGFTRTTGYGAFTAWNGNRQVTVMAHRIAYELLVGPVPDGLELDHLCRVRSCVRPDHLEAVTHAENVRRGDAGLAPKLAARARTTCRKGHPLDSDNVRLWRASDGYVRRYCRICQKVNRQRFEARRKEALAVAS